MERTHYGTDELLAYLDRNDGEVDILAMEEHISACTGCASQLDELRSFTTLLSDPLVWMAADERAIAEPLPLAASIRAETTIRKLVEHAIAKFDSAPRRALSLLGRAERLVETLPSDRKGHWLTEVWKDRANALRMCGEYDEALDAAVMAREIAEPHPGGGFDVAQAIYTRGTVLFKMGQYAEAATAASEAGGRFAEYGDLRRVAHAETLAAAALMEQGAIESACVAYQTLLARVEKLRDEDSVARVTANIAVCLYRLRRLGEAREHAVVARWMFMQRQMDAERLRTEWVIAMLDIATGVAGAPERARMVATDYERLGMPAEAGFVELSLVEECLRLGAWDSAEAGARRAIEAFVGTGAARHLMRALNYLREAVGGRTATPALAAYVQTYLRADDPRLVFAPPSAA